MIFCLYSRARREEENRHLHGVLKVLPRPVEKSDHVFTEVQEAGNLVEEQDCGDIKIVDMSTKT